MRQVPWESWQQWHHVACDVFSVSSSRVSEALDRISAWQSRGQLPVAVEITAEIIKIHRQDPHITAGLPQGAALSGEMLRMMYAMAIQRLVNGVVDQSQKRNTTSVASRAEDSQLPRLLVDIRHEAAHNELPGLPLLRHASKQALAWLQTHYWEVQEQLLSSSQTLLNFKLVEYTRLVLESLNAQQPLMREEGGRPSCKQHKRELKQALKGKKQQQRAVFRELLELAQFGASDLVILLVKFGLLVHNMWPTSGPSSANGVVDKGYVPEIPQSASVKGGLFTNCTLDDNLAAAWKETIGQLSEHMPQLPTLLLVGIVEHLTGHHFSVSTNRFESEGTGSGRAVNTVATTRFLGWAAWILDRFCSVSKYHKLSTVSAGSREMPQMELRANFSESILQELIKACLVPTLDKKSSLKLVFLLSQGVEDASFVRRAEFLARCSCPGGTGVGDAHRPVEDEGKGDSSGGSQNQLEESVCGDALSSPDTLTKARVLQQVLVNRATAREAHKSLSQIILDEGGAWSKAPKYGKGPGLSREGGRYWSKLGSWRPCAIGMLPSSFSLEGIVPQLDKLKYPQIDRVGGRVADGSGNQHAEGKISEPTSDNMTECREISPSHYEHTERTTVETTTDCMHGVESRVTHHASNEDVGKKRIEPAKLVVDATRSLKRREVECDAEEEAESEAKRRREVEQDKEQPSCARIQWSHGQKVVPSKDRVDICLKWQGSVIQTGELQHRGWKDLALVQTTICLL